MRQSLKVTRETLGLLFFRRCFYLFATLFALIALAPFIEVERGGFLVRYLASALVMLAAVAAVGRSILSFVIVLALAAPALALRWLALKEADPAFFDLALRFDAAVYVVTIVLLLRYVFDREVLTTDRLWGAASAYLMIGILWSFLYSIVDRSVPQSFSVRGSSESLQVIDLLYFSFSTLTTTGFGDIVPVSRPARTAVMLEGISGQLFLAILIARLVGVYPQRERATAEQ